MMKDKSLNMEMNCKLSSKLSTERKASRYRFVSLLSYLMLSMEVTAKYVVWTVRKSEYDNQRWEFREKVFDKFERSGNDFGA